VSLAIGPEGPALRVGEPGGAAADGEGLVLHYVLGLGDALAWERVAPTYRRRDRLALIVSVFAGLGLLQVGGSHPEILPELHGWPMAVAILLLPPVLVRVLQMRDRTRRAEARVGDGVEVVLEVQRDRLLERRSDRKAALALGARSLREVREAAEHVFLATREDVIIVPERALGDAEAKRAFAAHWRTLAA
jgi:hypothetical protein